MKRQFAVRDYLPLQQGLRRSVIIFCNSAGIAVRDYLPLQQGLRRYQCLFRSSLPLVRDYLPLQQGLRRGYVEWYNAI